MTGRKGGESGCNNTRDWPAGSVGVRPPSLPGVMSHPPGLMPRESDYLAPSLHNIKLSLDPSDNVSDVMEMDL